MSLVKSYPLIKRLYSTVVVCCRLLSDKYKIINVLSFSCLKSAG